MIPLESSILKKLTFYFHCMHQIFDEISVHFILNAFLLFLSMRKNFYGSEIKSCYNSHMTGLYLRRITLVGPQTQ